MRLPYLVLPILLVAGCASSAAIDARVAYWRAFLEREAPIGASAEQAEAAMRRAQLGPGRGTYVTVTQDGRRESNCRDPKSAVSGKEVSGVKGLYASYDIEVTVCLAPDGRVEKHVVGAWHRGL